MYAHDSHYSDFTSAFGGIVLQNYFEVPSEEIFFKIAHRCGILI